MGWHAYGTRSDDIVLCTTKNSGKALLSFTDGTITGNQSNKELHDTRIREKKRNDVSGVKGHLACH